MPSRASTSPLTPWIRIAVLAVTCFLTGKLGIHHTHIGEAVPLIWPPAGIAVAALYLWGLRAWPGVWIGVFAVDMSHGLPTVTAFASATGHTVAMLVAAGMLLHFGFEKSFPRLLDLQLFAAAGLVVGPLISATAGTLSMVVVGSQWSSFAEIWRLWAMSDAAGVLVVAPALLTWSDWRPADRHGSDRWREAALLGGLLFVVGGFVWWIVGRGAEAPPVAFLALPLLIWAAFRFGVRGATASTLLLSSIATVGTFAGHGPFARADIATGAAFLWSFLAVASAMAIATAVFAGRYRESTAVNESEERFKLAFESAEDGIWDWDLREHRVVVNERWASMLGFKLEEVVPTIEGWMGLIHPDDADGVGKALDAHLAGKIPVYQTEHRMRDRDGQWRWVLARGKVVERDEAGRPLRMSGTHKDITERKLAREAQVRSEALIRAIFETAPDGVITFSRRGKIESFNAAAERIFGFSAAEVLGRDIRMLIPVPGTSAGTSAGTDAEPELNDTASGEAGPAEDFLARYMEAGPTRTVGRTREMTGRRRDGKSFPVELSLGEVKLGETHKLLTCIVRDITVRKEAEEDLKLFRAMVENTSEGVQLTRIDDRIIVYSNPALEKMFGYDLGELMGQDVALIYASDERGTKEFLEQMNEQLTRHGIWRGEVRARRRSGSVFWCRVRISTFDHPRFGQVWVSVHEDITDQVRIDEERRWLEDQLRQAHRMESIGQLAGGVAHEFNNLLVVIGGHLGFALEDMPARSPYREDLEQAQGAADRAAALTHKLLAFSRRQVLQTADVDLGKVIGELMPMLRTAVTEHIALDFEPGNDLGTVHVDLHQVEQVVLNLCVNARDAVTEGGRITIRCENVDLDNAFCRRHPWARPGSFVQLTVADNGEGMDAVTLDRIFEPFFTTKEEGAGTGLGLAMVHGVVQQHQALLNVVSEPGQGATFTIYWPRVDRQVESSPPVADDQEQLTGAGLLILAEDDETVRNVARRILEEGGYKVLTAENGEEALRIFEKHGDEVDLVILDLIMPVMGGLAAREAILKIRSDARILLSSGYSAGPMHHGPGGVEIPLVVKPFDRRSLLARVREILVPSASPSEANPVEENTV